MQRSLNEMNRSACKLQSWNLICQIGSLAQLCGWFTAFMFYWVDFVGLNLLRFMCANTSCHLCEYFWSKNWSEVTISNSKEHLIPNLVLNFGFNHHCWFWTLIRQSNVEFRFQISNSSTTYVELCLNLCSQFWLLIWLTWSRFFLFVPVSPHPPTWNMTRNETHDWGNIWW